MAPIRILHIVDSLGKGGLENGLVNLIQQMDESRFEHTICAIRYLGANAERLPRDRVRVISLEKQAARSRVHVGALARVIREVKPDIVHSRNWAAVEGVLAARLVGGCKVIHSEHGLDVDTILEEPWRRLCFRRLAFQLAHRVLSVSYQLRELHASRTRFPERRITVVHNGVDRQRFFPDTALRVRVREELGIGQEEFCIGSVGNLFPVKDHMTLLHALANIAQFYGKWRLIMVGEGPERARLEGFVNTHTGWKDRVMFLGLSSRVPQLLNAMDVYVLPSMIEGISNALLEAMATGLPVIASETGGTPEVLGSGESGLLFRPGDVRKLSEQLLLLRTDTDRRLKLGQQALRRVREDFSIEAMVRKYEEIYGSLIPISMLPQRF
jgi:sugar transferase (PEP-CTERM/EpsH1 system associated)